MSATNNGMLLGIKTRTWQDRCKHSGAMTQTLNGPSITDRNKE